MANGTSEPPGALVGQWYKDTLENVAFPAPAGAEHQIHVLHSFVDYVHSWYDVKVTPRQRVEVFHLLFLRAFFPHLENPALVVLKGGCNLRFFHGSPRFSEDLDLDVQTLAARTLANKVEKTVLANPTFARLLLAHGLKIDRWSAPKQTDDVQRWKIAIVEGSAVPDPTKIEFSRRRPRGGGITEAIPSETLSRHGLPGPIMVTHYGPDEAAAQKMEALVSRTEPQARDVFDLNWLLSRRAKLPLLDDAMRKAASERVLAFSPRDFRGQVTAYLEPSEQAQWSAAAIEAAQLRVIEAIEAAS
jgi:hypothetical protein